MIHATSGRSCLLIIDDEPGLQRLMRRHAEHRGIDVVEALTGAEGFALAAEERPELILLDLHLPDGSGLDLLRRLKLDVRTKAIPVVAWSGSEAIDREADVLLAGAIAYFEKTDLNRLLAHIVELLVAQGNG